MHKCIMAVVGVLWKESYNYNYNYGSVILAEILITDVPMGFVN